MRLKKELLKKIDIIYKDKNKYFINYSLKDEFFKEFYKTIKNKDLRIKYMIKYLLNQDSLIFKLKSTETTFLKEEWKKNIKNNCQEILIFFLDEKNINKSFEDFKDTYKIPSIFMEVKYLLTSLEFEDYNFNKLYNKINLKSNELDNFMYQLSKEVLFRLLNNHLNFRYVFNKIINEDLTKYL